MERWRWFQNTRVDHVDERGHGLNAICILDVFTDQVFLYALGWGMCFICPSTMKAWFMAGSSLWVWVGVCVYLCVCVEGWALGRALHHTPAVSMKYHCTLA